MDMFGNDWANVLGTKALIFNAHYWNTYHVWLPFEALCSEARTSGGYYKIPLACP